MALKQYVKVDNFPNGKPVLTYFKDQVSEISLVEDKDSVTF